MLDISNPYTKRRLNQDNALALAKANGGKGAKNAQRAQTSSRDNLASLFGPGQTALSGRKASPGGTTMIRSEKEYV